MSKEVREVSNFTLSYRGVFFIKFPGDDYWGGVKAFLSFDNFLKICQLENIDVNNIQNFCLDIEAKNTTLQYNVFVEEDGSEYYEVGAGGYAEGLQDQGIDLVEFTVKD